MKKKVNYREVIMSAIRLFGIGMLCGLAIFIGRWFFKDDNFVEFMTEVVKFLVIPVSLASGMTILAMKSR